MFAGLVLVPPRELAGSFAAKVDQLKGSGLTVYSNQVKKSIYNAVGDEFRVAPLTAQIRLEKDQHLEPPTNIYTSGE